MTFATRQRRLFWYHILFGWVVDISISIAVAYLLNEPEDVLVAAFFIFIGIQVVSILLALRNAISTVAAHKLYAGKYQEDALVDTLEQYNLPPPAAFEESPADFLGRIAGDSDEGTDKRIAAAMLGGAVQGTQASQGFIRNILSAMAFERALTQYRERHPTK